MNIGLFGGTFDPIHNGHIALARAARKRCELGRIYFVPTNVPPHKQRPPMASYFDRYAMVVLATREESTFLPSLLEAPATLTTPWKGKQSGHAIAGANYTIDTVQRLKPTFKKSDRLFLLIGIDAFKDIATWHQAEVLFHECEFIVASRPGYSLADVANSLPESLRPAPAVTKPFDRQPAKGDLVLNGASIHLLDNVHQPVSATAIRESVLAKRPLRKFVDPIVAEYIKKRALYRR
jgi:nicotinate-nucleotide adenylyltransferase